MKNAVIASFIIGLASTCLNGATNHFANAEEFCPSGTISGMVTVTANNAGGATHTFKSGCFMMDETDVVLDASMALGSNASPVTTVTIGPNVNIGRRSVIDIKGCENTIAANRAPVIINIRDNQFGNDACIHANGAFSVGSVINIVGNRFNASTALGIRMPAPSGPTSSWAACVTINTLYLYGSKMSIASNNIYGTDIDGVSRIIGVNVVSSIFFMADGADFAVEGNNITSVCNPIALGGICSYGVMAQSLYAYTKGSYRVDKNNFYVAGGMVNSMPSIFNPLQTSQLSFSKNNGNVNTMYLPYDAENAHPFTIFNAVNIQSNTSLTVADNVFEVNGHGGMFVFNSDFKMDDNSTMIVRRNVVKTIECDAGLYFAEFSLAGQASVLVESNTLYRDDDTPVVRPAFYYGLSFAMADNSKFAVSANTLGGRAQSTALVVDLSPGAAAAHIFDNTASFQLCNNNMDGVALTSVDAVKAAVNAEIRGYISATGCPVPQTTTVPTTTTATTTSAAATTTTTTTAANVTDASTDASNTTAAETSLEVDPCGANVTSALDTFPNITLEDTLAQTTSPQGPTTTVFAENSVAPAVSLGAFGMMAVIVAATVMSAMI